MEDLSEATRIFTHPIFRRSSRVFAGRHFLDVSSAQEEVFEIR